MTKGCLGGIFVWIEKFSSILVVHSDTESMFVLRFDEMSNQVLQWRIWLVLLLYIREFEIWRERNKRDLME